LSDGLPKTLDKLNENKIKILIFKNPPTLNYNIKNIRQNISKIVVSSEEYKNANFFTDKIFGSLKNIKIII
jgi:hypothetical protein